MIDEDQEQLKWLSLRWPRRGYLLAFALVAALGAGALFDRFVLFNGVPAGARGDFQLMAQAWNLIDHYYVDRGAVSHAGMTYAAISAMTDSLGDTNHTTFLSRDQARRAGSAVQGKLVGIGIEIKSSNHQAVVVATKPGAPAEQAGIHPGDIILEVNGHSVAGLTLGQISARIAGEPGQVVNLTVLGAADKKKREAAVPRAAMKLNNVTWQRLPGTDIAHLRLAMFSEGVTAELRQALEDLKAAGARKIILDLRGNPGGALDEVIGATSQFLSGGNVLFERDSEGQVTPVPVKPGGVATDMPMVALIDGGSASDSEIMAGALHDANRAKLIGERTFGTGTVLSEFPLADGSVLYLAVEEWLTPSQHSFWHRGIDPDIRVTLPPSHIPLRPLAERNMTAAEIHAAGDDQLNRAMSVLAKENRR